MKQTAVEWLEEKLIEAGLQFTKGEALEIEQAKEIEKQQIENAYWYGGQDIPSTEKRCEEYYNETFNK
jgi:hypothetical protein